MECVRTGKAEIISTPAPQNNIYLRQWVSRKINNILCIINTLSQLHRHRTISRSTTSRCIDTVYYHITILILLIVTITKLSHSNYINSRQNINTSSTLNYINSSTHSYINQSNNQLF
ncbi:hypothetical protein Smp_112930 [Schistosoma mansoni]|uniref:Uncharacterized protein n=1 Tax=Schistosoma mansoni TaxID=6183 RepID=G4VER7_SCHMA|nr:hypothetical protein Smp_112930 [Schistosoma mansoni]|eukprot:XP_018651037.1 hypothetical protein Smp_112930 [Schistosoma mansoni]